MPWAVAGLAISAYSAYDAHQARSNAGGAQQAADPFSPYRSQLGQQYADALKMGGTTDPTKMPGYSQWMSGVLNPAMEATQGRLAAAGMAFSGTEKQDLMKVGQQGYYGFMTDYLNRLAQGSGAVNNPAQAAALGVSQQNAYDQAFMQGLGGMVQSGKELYKQWNTPGTYTTPQPDPASTGPFVDQMDTSGVTWA